MSDDLSELKRLAEAAKEMAPPEWAETAYDLESHAYSKGTHQFMLAASPSAILSLIARVEMAEARVKELEEARNAALEEAAKHLETLPLISYGYDAALKLRALKKD
jgi:hypothetical protein